MLAWAPIVRGGNREVALAALLAVALAGWAVVLAEGSLRLVRPFAGAGNDGQAAAPRWWWALTLCLVASPVWLGLLQLWPLPAQWWSDLAGRQPYLEALQAAGLAPVARLPLSLNPQATWAALWSGIPLALAFWMALRLPSRAVDGLMTLLLWGGGIQVVLAVAQFAGGAQSVLYFGAADRGLIGSFANRNHLADFLAMLVPVCFYCWLRLQHGFDADDSPSGWRAARKPSLVLVGFAFAIVILSTQSRGGILSGAIVLLGALALCGYSFRRQLKPWQRWALAGVLLLFLVLIFASIDLKGILARVEQGRLQTDAQVRNTMALATWDAARALWPWGSGMGTFEAVFPRFQPTLTPNYVNHAHNDYAQLAMELGAPAFVLVAALAALVARQLHCLARALRVRGALSPDLALRCFAGLGALALLLHSWVEFNMHIPALALTASFLMGVFLRPLPPLHRG